MKYSLQCSSLPSIYIATTTSFTATHSSSIPAETMKYMIDHAANAAYAAFSYSVTSSAQWLVTLQFNLLILYLIWRHIAHPALLHLITTSACHKLLSCKYPPLLHSLSSSVMSGQIHWAEEVTGGWGICSIRTYIYLWKVYYIVYSVSRGTAVSGCKWYWKDFGVAM